jgi:hypothetical protein
MSHLSEIMLQSKDFFPEVPDIGHELDETFFLPLLRHLHFEPLPQGLLLKL